MDRHAGLRARSVTASPTSSRSTRPRSPRAQSFADDLDADSLALIELVEALEEELGERTVGFRIEDEDLEDLKTVRDAVDYVVARAWPRRALGRAAGRRLDRAGRPASAAPFADPALLRRALAHRSWCAEHAGRRRSNERLEFLGDAVLGLVVTDHIFRDLSRPARGRAGQGAGRRS